MFFYLIFEVMRKRRLEEGSAIDASCASLRTALRASFLPRPSPQRPAVAQLAHHTRSAARLDEGALASRSPEQDPRGGAPRRASAVPQDVRS